MIVCSPDIRVNAQIIPEEKKKQTWGEAEPLGPNVGQWTDWVQKEGEARRAIESCLRESAEERAVAAHRGRGRVEICRQQMVDCAMLPGAEPPE